MSEEIIDKPFDENELSPAQREIIKRFREQLEDKLKECFLDSKKDLSSEKKMQEITLQFIHDTPIERIYIEGFILKNDEDIPTQI